MIVHAGILLPNVYSPYAVYAVALCLSVRPSVTRRYCNKTDKRRITKTTSYDNRGTLCAKDIDDIPIGSPPTGAQVQVGYGEKIAFFDRQ